MEAFRYGFRLMWRGCPKYLKRIGMGKVGSFDKLNQHGGEMFALPGEFSLHKEQAAQVLFHRHTVPQRGPAERYVCLYIMFFYAAASPITQKEKHNKHKQTLNE